MLVFMLRLYAFINFFMCCFKITEMCVLFGEILGLKVPRCARFSVVII